MFARTAATGFAASRWFRSIAQSNTRAMACRWRRATVGTVGHIGSSTAATSPLVTLDTAFLPMIGNAYRSISASHALLAFAVTVGATLSR